MEEQATCQICLKTMNEVDINMIDYDLDVCVKCEKEYKQQKESFEQWSLKAIGIKWKIISA